jgi:hypothetical protein
MTKQQVSRLVGAVGALLAAGATAVLARATPTVLRDQQGERGLGSSNGLFAPPHRSHRPARRLRQPARRGGAQSGQASPLRGGDCTEDSSCEQQHVMKSLTGAPGQAAHGPRR